MNNFANEKEGVAVAPHVERIDDVASATFVVVITFQPDLDILQTQLSVLSEEVMPVVVVDNGSVSQSEIQSLVEKFSFEFVGLLENVGVAAAQNAGIQKVRERGAEYLVLLDQDSCPQGDALRNLVRAYLFLTADTKFGAAGSSYTLKSGHAGSSFVRFSWFRFVKLYCGDTHEGLHEVDFLISSGTFLPIEVIEDVGLMEEKLFIDHVDTEWFLRAKSKGYRFYGCCNAGMNHGLGEHNYRFWLGRWRTVPVHRSFRYFFMFRNSLWLYRRPYAPLKWVTADVVRLIYIFFFSGVLMFSWENMRWMLKGACAGLRGADDPRSVRALKDVMDVISASDC